MGEMVTFPINGHRGSGYLAVPSSGSGPGVVVIQEWWGLVPHIKEVCDRYAEAGFVALAPDLYHGSTVGFAEPDEAGKRMMALNLDQAVAEMSGAIDHLAGLEATTGKGLGVTGFCMGGGLALVLAAARPDRILACAPYYGVIPWPDAQPDYSKMVAKVEGHFAAEDDFFGPELVQELGDRLRANGVEAELTIHPGVDHAFFNDARPEVYHAETADTAWASTIEFFRRTLG